MGQLDDQAAEILLEVGNPTTIDPALVMSLLSTFTSHGAVHPTLPFLYTKRTVIDILLQAERGSIDFTINGDVSDKQSQRFDHLATMRQIVQDEILRLEAVAGATRVPQFGALTTITPTVPPFPDAADRNSSIYQGDPYNRPTRFD